MNLKWWHNMDNVQSFPEEQNVKSEIENQALQGQKFNFYNISKSGFEYFWIYSTLSTFVIRG